jgi:hypothetical protein
MLSSATHAGRAATAETSSPELVLVDHALALHARERLPHPDDTLGRLEREIAFRRLAGPAMGIDHGPEEGAQPARPFAARRHAKLLVAAALAASLTAALLLGVNVDLRGTPAGADSYVLDTPVTTTREDSYMDDTPVTTNREATPSTTSRTKAPRETAPRREATAPRAARELGPRRFAWAPVPGASGYRVEFFRGDVRVYSAETEGPQLDLPPKWTFRGRTQRLAPGTYRWYVWPIRSGRLQSQATVQAALVVR